MTFKAGPTRPSTAIKHVWHDDDLLIGGEKVVVRELAPGVHEHFHQHGDQPRHAHSHSGLRNAAHVHSNLDRPPDELVPHG